MKKFFIIFTLFFVVLLLPKYTYASDFDDDQKSNIEAIVGKSYDELNKIDFVGKMKNIEQKGYFSDGHIVFFREVRNISVDYAFTANLYFENSKVTKYEIYVDDIISYKITLEDNRYDLFNNIRLDFLKSYNSYFAARSVGYNYAGTYNAGYSRTSLKDINNELLAVGFNALNILTVDSLNDFEVTTYQGDIKDFRLSNLFNVEGVLNQEIVDTNYELVNGNITNGQYYIYSSGVLNEKLVYQKMIINVVDNPNPIVPITTDPVITTPTTSTSISPRTADTTTSTTDVVIADYVVGYREVLEKGRYISYLKNKYNLDVTDVKSAYFSNQNKISKFDVEIDTNDEVLHANIVVVDNIAPIIIGNNITLSSKTKFSLDEYRNRLTAVDEIDGNISSKNIKINDLDNYLANHDKSGVYKVEASVSDLSGNTCKSIFEIYVTDNDKYGIYIENAMIIITNSSVASENDLIGFLKKNGLISSNNVTLTSKYFESLEPAGEYNLDVLEDDNKNTYIIHVQSLDEKKSEAKKEDNKKDDNFIIYIIIGSVSVIILLIILVYVIYKKKH